MHQDTAHQRTSRLFLMCIYIDIHMYVHTYVHMHTGMCVVLCYVYVSSIFKSAYAYVLLA